MKSLSRSQRLSGQRSAARHRRLRLEQLEDRRMLALTFVKTFTPDTIGPGSISTLRFDISNPTGSPAADVAFTDNLPSDVDIADPANVTSNCGGTVTAAEGGDTIALSDGMVGVGQSCMLTVDVTSSAPGTHSNTTGTLTSSLGSSGTASDDLHVLTTLPGFSKSFAPDSVPLGGRSTLTFTIDNSLNASRIGDLGFTDQLPVGMVVADPANASTDCVSASAPNTTVTAVPGSDTITLEADGSTFVAGFEVLPIGATCTVSVDVTATGIGELDNVDVELLADFTSSGKASDTLTSTVTPIALNKDFVNDPVPPGGTVTVDFVVSNRDRSASATDVAFTDDLAAALAGLTFSSLLSNSCGGSVMGVGTTDLSLTGGSVGAGGSCTISASLTVPAGATPGAYTNTTSAISAMLGGSPITGNMASDDLFVAAVPVFTKEFLEAGTLAPDPVINAGDDVVMRFTITNTSMTSGATDIAFLDDLTAFLPFPISAVLPASPCGGSVSLIVPDVEQQSLSFTGGSLAAAPGAGSSCTFDITLTVPVDVAPGLYLNTTEDLTATVDGETVIAPPASDTFTVIAAPTLQKLFTDDPVVPGSTVTLEFTLDHPGDSVGAVTDITFSDDLAPVLSGLTVNLPPTPDPPCGAGSTLTASAGDTLLTLMGGSLIPGGSCTFSVTLDVPAGATPGTYSNTTSGVSATVEGVTATSPAASDDLNVAGITFTKEFLDNPVLPGDTTTLRFSIANVHPTDDASITIFFDTLTNGLPGLMATGGASLDTCGGSLSGTTSLSYSGGSVLSGQTCTIEVPILVPAGAPDGLFPNTTSNLFVSQGGGSVSIDPASDTLIVDSSRLQLTKEFIDDPVAPGDDVTVEFTLTNLDDTQAASAVAFTDDLGAALTGLIFDSLPSDTCLAAISGTGTSMISVSGVSLAAGASCTIRASLSVPGGAAAGVYTNTTSDVTGTIGGVPVDGGAASDDLHVVNLLSFSKSFDGPTAPTGTPVLTFTLTNPGADEVVGLSFSDNLDDVFTGLAATNLPLNDVCGTGSVLSGESFITLTGGRLAAGGGMCSFDVELLVPSTATSGTFTNTTSELFQSGVPVADPATADLTVELPPAFAKTFAPDTIGAGSVSTLTFTIDNSGSAVTASSLDFTDNLPAGVVVADPASASTTCTGGTLTAGAGSGVISYSGGSVGAGASCTVQVDVTSSTAGDHVNTTGDLTSSSGSSGTATDTLTVLLPPLFSKAFVPDRIEVGQTSTLTFTIDNAMSGVAATGLDFTDNLPAGVVVADPSSASTTCVGGTLTAGAGTGVISYTGGSVGAGASCTIQVDVTSSTDGDHVNTTGDLTSSAGSSGTATDTLTVLLPPLFDKVFAPDSIEVGQTSTLTFTVDNSASGVTATGLDFTDNLPAGVVVADPSNASTTCTGGTLTAGAGTGVVSYSGGSVGAGASCTVQVDVTSSTQGDYVNTTGDLTSTSGNSGSATDTLRVTVPPAFDKVFAPDSIEVGQTSTLTFTVDNSSGVVTATGLDLTDNLPAGVVVADPSNASTTCTGGTLTAGAGTGVVSYSGGSVGAGASCTVQVDVTSSTQGDHVNTTGDLTSTSGNSGTATDTLRVTLPPAFDKVFAPASIEVGQTSTLTFTVDNTAGDFAADSLNLVDNLPAGVVIADPTNASTTCTGMGDASAGASSFSFGGSVAAGSSCTVQFDVTSSTQGDHVNTTEDLTSTSGNSGTATDTLRVTLPPAFDKVFSPASIEVGQTSTLTFTVDNTAGDFAADSLDLVDNLPAGVVIADPTNASTTCTGMGDASAGASAFSFSGSVAAGSSCTIQFDVTSSTQGDHVNATEDLTSTSGNSGTATDTLRVTLPPAFDKVFSPASIEVGQTSTLTFTVDNTDGDFAADSLDLVDNLPAGVVIADPTNASTTCTGMGDASAGASSFSFSGSVAAGSSCTIQFDVTSSTQGDHVNTTEVLTSTSGNSGTATDTLRVTLPPTFDKVFSPDQIETGQVSTLTFTIDNTVGVFAAGGLNLVDNLPAGVVVADPSNASTTCSGGTLTADAGTGVISYTGGSVGGGASCTVQVDVTSSTQGDHDNTTEDLTSTSGNSGTAADTLAVRIPPQFSKIFAQPLGEDGIEAGEVTPLTFSIDNTASAFAANSLDFTDHLPAAVTVADPNNVSTTCSGGTITADAGTGVISSSGGSVAAGTRCSVRVDVTSSTPGDHVNTTGDLTSDLGNSGTATDTLTVLPPPPPTFSKSFDGLTTATGTPILRFTITNPASALPASDLSFTDDLNAVISGLVAINLPLSDVCGTGSLLSGTSVLTFSGGDVGPMSSCMFDVELSVPVTAAAGTFTNTTSDLLQGGVPVTDPATADLIVEPPPAFAKAFDPGEIVAGEVSTLAFTIDNSASALPAGSLDFTDALPAGVVIANPAAASTDCLGGTLTAAPGSSVVSYTGGSIAAGASCTIEVDVTSVTPGDHVNTTGDLTSSSGDSGAATETLTVVLPPPPLFSKAFAPDQVIPTAVSTLTFTIDNAASLIPAGGLDFTDNLPATVEVASPPNASTTCTGGTLTAVAGSGVVTYTGGTVAAGSSCSVQVDVTPTTSALHVNTSGDLTSDFGNSGVATDSLDSRLMLEGEPLMPGLNEVTVGNANSDGLVLLLVGTQPGNQMLTVQGVQITTAFADPFPVSFAEVDEAGTASILLSISESQVGETLQYQVFQLLPIFSESPVLSLPVVTAPLLAEGGEGPGAEAVSAEVLPPLVEVAVSRWAATGLTASELDMLRQVDVQLSELPIGVLGNNRGDVVFIDFNAAGHGWFVDPTPAENSEFEVSVAATEFAAGTNSPAAGAVDLLTVITHELGHFLGFEDIPSDEAGHQIMADMLPDGTRRVPMSWQNPSDTLDVNDDGSVSPIDALIISNALNAGEYRATNGRLPRSAPTDEQRRFFDTSGDGVVSAIDALRIINHLNADNTTDTVDSDGVVAEAAGADETTLIDAALLELQTELQVQRQGRDAADANEVIEFEAAPTGEQGNAAQGLDTQPETSGAQTVDTDLALLEWLEQQSDG